MTLPWRVTSIVSPHVLTLLLKLIEFRRLAGLLAEKTPRVKALRAVSEVANQSAEPGHAPNALDPSRNEAERRAELQAVRFASKTPMGRNGDANDVAQAVLFFATGPRFITGQTLVVER